MKQEQLREMVRGILKEYEEDGYVIIRAEARREWGLRFSDGRLERVSTGREEGMGIQAFTPSGVSGFASADILSSASGRRLMERALALANRNEGLGAEGNTEIWKAKLVQEALPNPANRSFAEMPLNQLTEVLSSLHISLIKSCQEAIWQTSYRQVEDMWCIGRSDGSLVSYVIPRAVLMHQGTVHRDGKNASSLVHRSGTDMGILLDEQADHHLEHEAAERAGFSAKVCEAPFLSPGHYPVVIDYGLAKGLAHEAFGHAVESDHMQESVLGDNGKLKRGLRVARPGIHIIDGPLQGDWAYQPFSANGLPRETVWIVRDGVLEKGLGDIFSAEEAGIPVSGAGRAESYAHIPLPRMSNIRLVVGDVIPLPEGDLMEDAENVRQALLAREEIKQGEKTLLLVGYRGGQVNPKTGDFVFQCEGIIDIGAEALPIYRPSIFSGKILSALQAIKLGLGEETYDAIGTCGKNGQAVPSSGGSNRYLLLEADRQVSLGGEA
ncbi:MAG: TldD/PmbA family protein [Desulfitobacteriaceae bacterium]